ncbi:hypothetical protein EAH57_04580 [Acinetobacter sp. 2JN-4]|uniref:hypothetical protein n=1 Tax=Acinetobacter sp. 2JN-4 TaxID=2479844 RepID=UPI000EF971FA|nr:hypothetical protein [Acinetobacter sp. 2JN-4]RLZ10266.1 hypothetical protein EAH57_04580 [Acinetobacter sp. 2JN-4]
MFAIYKVMLPLVLIVFLLMGLWVSYLHFPWEWIIYAVMGLEVLLATVAMTMEYQAQNVGSTSGWGSMGIIGGNVVFAFLLGLFRCVMWWYQKI